MSKKDKEKLDKNIREFFEEIDQKTANQEFKEGEYEICPGCGKKVSKKVRICPHCDAKLYGTSYVPLSDAKIARVRWIVGTILIVGFFVFWIIFQFSK